MSEPLAPNANTQVDMPDATSSGSTVKLVLTAGLMVVLAGVGALIADGTGAVLGAGVAVLFYFSIVINQEYERAVVFRLGSYNRVMGPGLNFKIPFLEWVTQVDYRVKTVNVHPQKVLTKDNVTTEVDAIVFYKLRRDEESIKDAVLEVEDFDKVTISYGKTMLRAEIGKVVLDELLQERNKVAEILRKDLDDVTNDFGVEIRDVEIRDVSIPDSMERAMAAQAEAERSRRAKIKEAQGELQAAVEMRAASDILGSGGYKLRMLETIDRVAQENATVVTVPAELIPAGDGDEAVDSPVHDLVDDILENIDMEDLHTDLTPELEDVPEELTGDDAGTEE